jgi:hypothetical protein
VFHVEQLYSVRKMKKAKNTAVTLSIPPELEARIVAVMEEWQRRQLGWNNTRTQVIMGMLKAGVEESEKFQKEHPFKP